ncbi:MAG: DNA polymerase III subunit delta [Gammaproteobacteria bacterium]
MRTSSDKLNTELKKKLAAFYWLAGDETLLAQEALTQLRNACRQAGFNEWELVFVDRGFDWQSLLQSGNSMSLFSDKKIIELRLQSAKLDDAGKAALKQYLASPNPDNILILVSPRVEPAALNTKWFKGLEAAGVFITVWPINADKLPRWIHDRMHREGINADRDAIAMLAERVEGNLLAADQEIQKLRILTGATPEKPVSIDRKQIMTLVADSSRYNTFSLIDAALNGDARRCVKVLNSLRSEGTEILQLLGSFNGEVRRLIAVAQHSEKGSNISDAMRSEGIRPNHQKEVANALQRLRLSELEALLRAARQIDLAVKGLVKTDPWIEFTQLILRMSGHPILPHSVLS